MIEKLIAGIISVAIGAALGWAARSREARRARNKAHEDRIDALCEGMLSLLRGELLAAYEAHVVKGAPIDLVALESIERAYGSYHRLGGNDVGTRLYEELSSRALEEVNDNGKSNQLEGEAEE